MYPKEMAKNMQEEEMDPEQAALFSIMQDMGNRQANKIPGLTIEIEGKQSEEGEAPMDGMGGDMGEGEPAEGDMEAHLKDIMRKKRMATGG